MKKFTIFILNCASFFTMLTMSACGSNDYSMLPVQKGEFWGYVTPKGKYVVNPIYDNAFCLCDGRALVKKDGKFGYINAKGKVVIPIIYDQGTDFSEGKAFVVKKGGTPVCIDLSGKELFSINDDIECVWNYENGKALSMGKDTMIFLDSRGKSHEKPFGKRDLFVWKGKNGKYGYVNKEGETIIDYQFDMADDFHEGLACVKMGNSYGFIDKKGNYAINPQFAYARQFNDGLAAVKQGSDWGFIDKQGAVVINYEYDDVSDFIGKYAFVLNWGKVGIIDAKGKMTVQPQFDGFRDKSWEKSSRIAFSMKYKRRVR